MSIFDYAPVKRVVATTSTFPQGMAALLEYCRTSHPHPVWEQMERLDFGADSEAVTAWFAGRLPIPRDAVVLWFAPWDMAEGFDLRAAPAWSRDAENWEWWYDGDVSMGSYRSRVLTRVLALARDADQGAATGPGVYQLTEWVLALGYLCLAGIQAMEAAGRAELLGDREELWAVAGFADAVFGLVLGRMGRTGFDRSHP